jgi:catechol 2,3-dioxygenase-like lactoylglutathione lyase family enzyme
MRQRVHLITLGVDDLDRSRAFYQALGWKPADSPEGVVAFDLWGATLGLYLRADLSRDMGRELPRGSGAVTLACNVREKEEVADVAEAARAAGAEILKEPHDVFWGGHIAYFADPDGHVWEVAWNPFSPLGPNDEFQWGGA